MFQFLIKRSIRSISLGAALLAMTVSGQIAAAGFKPVPTQFIAALADPGASSGTGAEHWGLWTVDPGPRGVRLRHYEALVAAGGVAPASWKFDQEDWWLEENGLIMEAPAFGMPPGRYIVTGTRETTAIMTVHPKDANGAQAWELSDAATVYDVTHLRCRSARYTPAAAGQSCSPADAPRDVFPMVPARSMPEVPGCVKKDYAVLFIVGLEE